MPNLEKHEVSEHWRKANAHHHRANRKGKEMLEEANALGKHLLAIKQTCLHGEWLPTLAENFEGSQRTAYAYIKTHEHWSELKPYLQCTANLNEPASLNGFHRYLNPPEELPQESHEEPTAPITAIEHEKPESPSDAPSMSSEPGAVASDTPGGSPASLHQEPDDTKEVMQYGPEKVQGRSRTNDNRDGPATTADRVGGERPTVGGKATRKPSRPDDAPRIIDEPTGSPRRSPFDIELAYVNWTIDYLKGIDCRIALDVNTLNKYIVGLRRAADTLARYSPTQVDVALPEWIDSDLWDYYMVLRGKKDKGLTAMGARLLLDKLDGYRAAGQDPNEIIKQTIREGWQGLFPIKDEKQNGSTTPIGSPGDDARYAQYEGLIQ